MSESAIAGLRGMLKTKTVKNPFLHRTIYVLYSRMEKRIGGGARPGRRRIDGAVKGAFVTALRRGMKLEEAARAAGVSLPGLYGARRRDRLFRDAWAEALAQSAAPHLVRANNQRGWQLRRMRNVRFTGERKQAFLAHFAGTCDATAAAQAAGVAEATVYKHRQYDPDFSAAWSEALATGYARLEAEAVRQRLAMQERVRAGLVPEGEVSADFERVLKLLTRYERRGGGVGFHGPRLGHTKRWSFEESLAALERKLKAFGVTLPPPRADEGRGEPLAGGGEEG